MDNDCMDTGIGGDDFKDIACGGVTLKDAVNVFTDALEHGFPRLWEFSSGVVCLYRCYLANLRQFSDANNRPISQHVRVLPYG
jgi:hypothetical protein